MNETKVFKTKLINRLIEISNYPLKNGVRNEDNKSYKDYDLKTKTDLLKMPIFELLNYRIVGYSSTAYQEHFKIYVHRKKINEFNKILPLIKR